MDTLGGRTMRDTKAYWQDIHDQAENVIYKSHGDSGWLWMFELSQRMLNKCAQKNPMAATTGSQKLSTLNYNLSLSRKAVDDHA
ncbi:hypothetical protein FAM18133_01408 [Lacticaseibacillus paracasei]|uniref:hypothetical protein n=1 Tax=Lacticaseibacillus paracasei TaxID=1597 RepID=UPI0009B9AD95|nr:hypothetical protein [Lacticaseibacillus paracasei]MCD0434352.1 hypothetical protein [Lacticaseibacillus paracasei subsp. paracasei]RND74859.1 hypothetical protein FAM18133_01408 [Lacticaseibacillus paracasei]